MLLTPKTEWPVVAEEPFDLASLYTGYIMPLAAIPPVATLIGSALRGHGRGFGFVLTTMIVFYVVSLVAVYVFAFIAGKLAPSFGGRDDLNQAVKLIAFAGTARWVGGIVHIIPWIGVLLSFVMSLYGLYLLWLGTTPMLGVPEDRAVMFILVLVVIAVVVFLVIGAIFWAMLGASLRGGM